MVAAGAKGGHITQRRGLAVRTHHHHAAKLAARLGKAVLGKDGVIEGVKAGSILIDMSSIAPLASREVGAELAAKGVDMLDAPVSGGEPKAVAGTLAIMVGGKEAHSTRSKTSCSRWALSAVLCGDIGAGNVTKLANQIIVALNIAAMF